MCVAAVIFSPVSLEYLECMENDNPHGAGIAWLQGDSIRFMKGLTAADINQLQIDEVMTYPYLMHYRWATHGEKVPQWTHPFPIGPRALLGELTGNAPAVLIHNGTWNRYHKAATEYIRLGNYEIPEEVIEIASDTAVAAWLAQDNPAILDEVLWATAVAEIREVDGKKTMEITTRGQWYDKDGNWYSNLNWVPWNGYSFPSMYANDARDPQSAYWTEWERRYRAGEDTSTLIYPGENPTGGDIDWDKYFLAPYSTRGEKDKDLNFDSYVERFRTPKTGYAQSSALTVGSTGSKELSWDEYLISKYGAPVAAQIKADCFPEVDDSGPVSDSGHRNLDLVCVYSTPDGEQFEDIDPDAVSEDWETVNAILERRMRGKWGT